MSPLTEVRKDWKLVNDVFHLGEVISHDDVIFGTELELSLNYVFSFIIYYNTSIGYRIGVKNVRFPLPHVQCLITSTKCSSNVKLK